MSRHITIAHEAMANVLNQGDVHSLGVYNELMSVYPAFARKLFHNNQFMRDLVTSNRNPMNILDYAVCGRCETLAPWDKSVVKDGRWHKRCTCLSHGCGASTTDPVTLREWILYELKRKVKDEAYFAALEVAIDQVAMTFLRKAANEYAQIEMKNAPEMAEKIGLHMPDGSFHEVKKAPRQQGTVEFYEGSESDINEDIAKLQQKLKEMNSHE